MKKIIVIILLSIFFSFCGSRIDEGKKNKEIYILHAGSLSIPFRELSEAFMKNYPEYKVLLEGHGSRTCARHITELKRRADIMASADSAVIRNLLMPEYADFCVDFTTNEMVLMFNEKSKFADEINTNNWFEILLKPNVQFGHSDPNADPCGYRAVLVMKLAEKYYKRENLFKDLKVKMPKKNIRPKETDLIAMLEAGELDYIFIYRSVAKQHHSKYVLLPDEINLKSAKFSELYKTVRMNISGKKPGEIIEKKGAPMVYGITIPKNAKNPEGAVKFFAFLFGKKGREIMKKNGQTEIFPPKVDRVDKLPEKLKTFFKMK